MSKAPQSSSAEERILGIAIDYMECSHEDNDSSTCNSLYNTKGKYYGSGEMKPCDCGIENAKKDMVAALKIRIQEFRQEVEREAVKNFIKHLRETCEPENGTFNDQDYIANSDIDFIFSEIFSEQK